MKRLLEYLNSLEPGARAKFIEASGTSENYLRKAVSTDQRLSAELCVSIELASFGNVTRKHLRPDDWARIWPELSSRRVA